MSVVVVPHEVIWVMRLNWIWLIVNVVVNYVLSGHNNLIGALIYLMVASTIIPIIWVINYFLKKANKWLMWVFVGGLILLTLIETSKLLTISVLTDSEIQTIPSAIIRILFGVPIVYLLLKQKAFFHKKVTIDISNH